MEKNEAEYNLEGIIDSIGLNETLQAMVKICLEKADHIRSSYDDKTLAKSWEHDSKVIDKITLKINN